MKRNFLDRFIEFVTPAVATERYRQRVKIEMLGGIKDEWKSHQRRYDAASKSRHTSDWFAPNQSVNLEVHQALSWLRDRSRDLGRNNPYARRVMRLYANNVVGTGILPTPKNLRPNQTKALKDAWYKWAEKLVCDYDQNNNFYGLQWLAMRTVAESGECIIRRVRADSSYALPIRLQVLEADYIDSTHHTGIWANDANGLSFIEYYGIRFNQKGERLGYWLWRQHPSEFATQSDFVPAQDVIHLYEVERPGQIRGIPILASVMIRLRDLDDYEFTERVRNKIAACFTVFIEDTSLDPNGTDSYDTEKIEPGAIEQLPPGKKVTVAQPPSKDGFGDYTKANLRGIASGTGASYEGLTGDYSNVNFSSGRMGWIEFAREVEHWQWKIIIPKFCDKVYDWFIEASQLAGILPFNGVYVQVTWTPPRREMIDPKTETDAIVSQLRAGLISWQEVVRIYGYIPSEVIEELKEDKDMWDKLGLMPFADPRFDTNRIDPAEKANLD